MKKLFNISLIAMLSVATCTVAATAPQQKPSLPAAFRAANASSILLFAIGHRPGLRDFCDQPTNAILTCQEVTA